MINNTKQPPYNKSYPVVDSKNLPLKTPYKTSAERGKLDTLAQTETATKAKESRCVYGNGSNISDNQKLYAKAKKKSITQALMMSMIKIAQKNENVELEKSFKNTYYCMSTAVIDNNMMYGKYCKNRFCELCSGIRKAQLINKYLSVIEKWETPYFVTLTVKACPAKNLKFMITKTTKAFELIKNKMRKRHQRGNGPLFMGIKSLECNFNPNRHTYNPHYHIIVANKEIAETLIKEWLLQWGPKYSSKKAQNYRPVQNSKRDLIELIKYGTKIISNGVKNNNNKGLPTIYVKAIYNIVDAFQNHRLFGCFGISATKQQETNAKPKILHNAADVVFFRKLNDWVRLDTGETLSGFKYSPELSQILTHHIDIESY